MKKYQELLDRFGQGSEKLFQAVDKVPEAALDYSPDGNCWSIRQLVHHLADGGAIWGMFIKQAL